MSWAIESFVFSGILLRMHPLRLHIGILLGTLCPLRRHIGILLGTLCPFKALQPVSLIVTSSLRASPVFFCVTCSCWPLYVPIYHVAFYPVCPKSHGTLKVTWTIPKLCVLLSWFVRLPHGKKKKTVPPPATCWRGSRGARFKSVVVTSWRSTSALPRGNVKE